MTSMDEPRGTQRSAREALGKLLLRAGSPDPEERFEAVADLALRPPSMEVDEALVRATSDPDPDVAARAILELAEREHPSARQLVLELLHHGNPTVRFSALRAAGVVDISPSLEAAWRALDGRRWVDRMAGAAALAQAGVESALPRIHALTHDAKNVRRYAAEAHLLGSASLLGDLASADLFLGRLSARGPESRLAAAAFLERRGRIQAMARIVGADRLRSALLAGKRVQEASRKPGYAHRFDDLLLELDLLNQR